MKKKKLCVKLPSKNFRGLYRWGKFLGIIPLSLSRNNKLERSNIGLCYGGFLTLMYFSIYYHAVIEIYTSPPHEGTPNVVIFDFLTVSCQFFETAATWFVSAIFQNRIIVIVTSFATAERTSEKLGIQDDWDKQLREFKFYLIPNNILFLFSLAASNIMWHFFTTPDQILFWSRFDAPATAAFNQGFILIWCFILVRRKFRRLNETLQLLVEDECINANEETGGFSGLIRPSRCDPEFLLNRLNMISQLHRELRDIIHRVKEHFASFILFSIGNSLTCLTFNLYVVCRHMKDYPRGFMDLIFLGAVSHWTLYPLVSLLVISNVCGSTSDEANSTGGMLHKMLARCNGFRDFREAAKFNSLSLDLLQNPVRISVFGLFKLDHFLFYRTVTSATSYLTIMLQLYS